MGNNHHSSVHWAGRLSVDPTELRAALRNGWTQECVKGWDVEQAGPDSLIFLPKPNLVVNTGINNRLDLLFAIGSPPGPVNSMGVDNGTVNPVTTTTRSADGNSTLRRIQAFDGTAVRTNQTVAAVATFTQATVAFIMKRLFLSSLTTDAAGTLHSMTNVFTLDLTAFVTWSQTFTATVTGTGA